MINKIIANNLGTTILVAQILRNKKEMANALIHNFNISLLAVVQSVQLVNSDVIDGTHPTEIGYWKLANEWYPAIVKAGQDRTIEPADGVVADGGPRSLSEGGGDRLSLQF